MAFRKFFHKYAKQKSTYSKLKNNSLTLGHLHKKVIKF